MSSTGGLMMRCVGEEFALPLATVAQVAQMVAMAQPPPDEVASTCLGLVDFHGALTPAIDIGAHLGLTEKRSPEQLVDGYLVLVPDGDKFVALAIDEVREVSEAAVLALPQGARLSEVWKRNAPAVLGMIPTDLVQVPVIDPLLLLGIKLRGALDAANAYRPPAPTPPVGGPG